MNFKDKLFQFHDGDSPQWFGNIGPLLLSVAWAKSLTWGDNTDLGVSIDWFRFTSVNTEEGLFHVLTIGPIKFFVGWASRKPASFTPKQ